MTPYKGPHNFKTELIKSGKHLLNLSKAGFMLIGKKNAILSFSCPHFAFEGREYIIIQSGKKYLLFEVFRD